MWVYSSNQECRASELRVCLARAINVGTDTQELLELPNGCLCCSIKDIGVAAIEKLMQRKGAFDHILLETTGLADPGQYISSEIVMV